MRKLLFSIALLTSFCASGQMKYKFKQYMLHSMMYNPGYIDLDTKYSFNTLYRRQWLRKENFPEAFCAYGHYQLDPYNAVGLVISNDLINKYNQFEIGANYCYNLFLGDDYNLGLGMKVGMIEQNLIKTDLTYFDPVEPVLSDGEYTQKFLNVGAGVSLTSKDLTINFSVPQFFGNHLLNPEKTYNLKYCNFFFNAGYKFRQNDWFVTYPSIMFYAVRGSKFHGAAHINFLASQLVWFGAGLDTDLTVNAHFGLFLQSGFRIAYTVDNRFFPKNQTTGFSHELSVSYAKSLKYNPFHKKKTNKGFRRPGGRRR